MVMLPYATLFVTCLFYPRTGPKMRNNYDIYTLYFAFQIISKASALKVFENY